LTGATPREFNGRWFKPYKGGTLSYLLYTPCIPGHSVRGPKPKPQHLLAQKSQSKAGIQQGLQFFDGPEAVAQVNPFHFCEV